MTSQNLYQDQSYHLVVDLVNSQRGMMNSWTYPSYHQFHQTVSLHQMKLLEMMTLILMISLGDLKT